MSSIEQAVRRLRRRLSVQQWISLSVVSLLFATVASFLWLTLTRLFPALGDPIPVVWGLMALGAATATVVSVARRTSLVEAALRADDRLGLRERVTSSLQLAEAEGPMIEAVHLDARGHIDRLNVRRDFPYYLPRASRWLVLALFVLVAGKFWMPEFDLLKQRQRQEEAAAKDKAIRMKAQRLRLAATPLKSQQDEGGAATGEMSAAEEIERVAEKLESYEITEKQALAKLSNLATQLSERRKELASESAAPKLAGDTKQFGMSREFANDIQNGRFGEAAERVRQMKKQMEAGQFDKRQLEKMKEDLENLSNMLGGQNPQLGHALSEISKSLQANNMQGAVDAMADLELSMEDIASVLEQMKQIDTAMVSLNQWKSESMGSSDFCRTCGTPLEVCGMSDCQGTCSGKACTGMCQSCMAGIGGAFARGPSQSMGGGMGNAGRGRGGMVGDLPDTNATFNPTILPGTMTQGKLLASILQKGAPEEGAEATLDFVQDAMIQVRQEAEQALTKEEIPPGAKEFVRQYFGSLEIEE